jgi:hypothetical protein
MPLIIILNARATAPTYYITDPMYQKVHQYIEIFHIQKLAQKEKKGAK